MSLLMLALMPAGRPIPPLCSSEGKRLFPKFSSHLRDLNPPCRKQTWWHTGGYLHLDGIVQTGRQGCKQRHFGTQS